MSQPASLTNNDQNGRKSPKTIAVSSDDSDSDEIKSPVNGSGKFGRDGEPEYKPRKTKRAASSSDSSDTSEGADDVDDSDDESHSLAKKKEVKVLAKTASSETDDSSSAAVEEGRSKPSAVAAVASHDDDDDDDDDESESAVTGGKSGKTVSSSESSSVVIEPKADKDVDEEDDSDLDAAPDSLEPIMEVKKEPVEQMDSLEKFEEFSHQEIELSKRETIRLDPEDLFKPDEVTRIGHVVKIGDIFQSEQVMPVAKAPTPPEISEDEQAKVSKSSSDSSLSHPADAVDPAKTDPDVTVLAKPVQVVSSSDSEEEEESEPPKDSSPEEEEVPPPPVSSKEQVEVVVKKPVDSSSDEEEEPSRTGEVKAETSSDSEEASEPVKASAKVMDSSPEEEMPPPPPPQVATIKIEEEKVEAKPVEISSSDDGKDEPSNQVDEVKTTAASESESEASEAVKRDRKDSSASSSSTSSSEPEIDRGKEAEPSSESEPEMVEPVPPPKPAEPPKVEQPSPPQAKVAPPVQATAPPPPKPAPPAAVSPRPSAPTPASPRSVSPRAAAPVAARPAAPVNTSSPRAVSPRPAAPVSSSPRAVSPKPVPPAKPATPPPQRSVSPRAPVPSAPSPRPSRAPVRSTPPQSYVSQASNRIAAPQEPASRKMTPSPTRQDRENLTRMYLNQAAASSSNYARSETSPVFEKKNMVKDLSRIYKENVANATTPPASPKDVRKGRPSRNISEMYASKNPTPNDFVGEKLNPRKHNMSTAMDKEGVRSAYDDVRDDNSETEWAVFKFDGNRLCVTDQGSGFDQFKQHFGNEDRGFGYIRITTGDEMSKRAKFVFVTWVGPSVSVMKKAKMSTDKALMKDIIQNFSVELQIENEGEFSHEQFKYEVDKAAGARYGTGVRDL